MHIVLTGLLTGLSLIVAIGAQNAFVLRLGLMRAHVGVAVFICALSDAILIVVGTAGMGAIVQSHKTTCRKTTPLLCRRLTRGTGCRGVHESQGARVYHQLG